MEFKMRSPGTSLRAATRGSLAAAIGLAGAGLLSIAAAAPKAAPAIPARAGTSADADAFFESKVRPVLVERCISCHGEKNQYGKLRLDSRAAMLKGGATGPSLLPGAPERSPLIQAVRYAGRLKMPPTGRLRPDEVETLTRWVQQGASWPTAAVGESSGKPWAFQPVRKPALPTVKNRSWVKTPVDTFVLAELEKRGLKPAPPADRRTLIRRAYFDLTGLPPAPEEVEAFVNDRAPDAFAKVVEKLLASPQYGERWGRHWLDVARYADSRDARYVGADSDIADAWRYRDWVVKAFNQDLPYNQFIVDQIAGDLVPGPGPDKFNADGLVATGLLSIGEWGTGDADKDKMMTDIVDDQINVVSRAFMGLTVSCARCHDHKFDPISTKDYYGLAGIFFSTHILPSPGAKTAGSALLRSPLLPPSELARIESRKTRIAELEKQVKARRDEAYRSHAQSLLPQTGKYLLAAWDYGHRPSGAPRVSLATFAEQQDLQPAALRQWLDFLGLSDFHLMTKLEVSPFGKTNVRQWRGDPDCPNFLLNRSDQDVTILTFKLPAKSVAMHPGPAAGVAARWTSPVSGTVRIAGRVADADPSGGDGITWAVEARTGAGATLLTKGEIPNGGGQLLTQGLTPERLAQVTVKPGDEIDLQVLPKREYTCDTTTVELSITLPDGKRWDLTQDLVTGSESADGNPHADRFGNPGVWSFLDMAGTARADRATVEAQLAGWTKTAAAMANGAASRADLERAAQEAGTHFNLIDARSPFWIRDTADERLLPETARTELAGMTGELDRLKKEPVPEMQYALAAREGGVPGSVHEGIHDARVHIRGNYLRLGDVVPRHFPVVLAGETQPPITEGSGRLPLAQWLARADHPLTGRVLVNRVWEYHFGEGIVRTPNNFGKLGERPTHPELLDWLAATFTGEVPGSEVRVSGTTSNHGHSEPGTRNPEQKLGWSIKSLHRLIMLSSTYQQSSVADAATVKTDPDNRMWGRFSRRRLEAEEVRDAMLAVSGRLDRSMRGLATRDFMSPRRTLYQMAIRSDRSGFRPLFDAADPETSVDRRTVSTVAPQALFLLNHPFSREQSAALAERLKKEAPAVSEDRIRRAYALLYGRQPTAEELRIGLQFVSGSPADADLAWREYCQLLMCANEFIYVD